MSSRIQVRIISFIAVIILVSGLSCSPGSQDSKTEGSGTALITGLSPSAALEVLAVDDAINAQAQYALTTDDLASLQTAGVVEPGEAAALQPFIKH